MKLIEEILADLYKSDFQLKKYDSELRRTLKIMLKSKPEVEVDEAYVPVGCKGKRCTRPRRRGSGRRRGRNTLQRKPFFTLFERGSRKSLF